MANLTSADPTEAHFSNQPHSTLFWVQKAQMTGSHKTGDISKKMKAKNEISDITPLIYFGRNKDSQVFGRKNPSGL